MKISRFEDLECWQKASNLVRNVYAATWDGALDLQAEIMEQLAYIREWGGQFVTVVPSLK